jgi:hypothetical protein
MERLMAMVAGGKVDLRPLITHSMKISETPAGYDLFRERKSGVLKIALRPELRGLSPRVGMRHGARPVGPFHGGTPNGPQGGSLPHDLSSP